MPVSQSREAGLNVADHQLVKVGCRNVAVIPRFDRKGDRRIPFLSGASLIGLPPGAAGAYTLLAGGIRQFGHHIAGDLRELWGRLIFSLLASNYDDHLRNHGFLIRAGKSHVVDIDLKAFFDRVNHDRLLHLVGRKVRDKCLLRLIGEMLRAPLRLGHGQEEPRREGTPQGGPLSPLLANIHLHPLDGELEKRGLAFVRYADDIAIFCASARSAERVLASVTRWIERELMLPVNREKSGNGPSDGTALLGFRLEQGGTIRLAPQSVERLKAKVRQLWDARQSLTSEGLRDQWRSYIDGWWSYFRLTERRWDVTDLSGWIRHHMRKCFWLRWHHPQGRRNALRRLGLHGEILGMASSAKGAWPLAGHWVMQRALKNNTLSRYGFTLPWETATA